MAANALYFPYISVPDGRWTTQMLLYWDQLSSIVPYDHVEHPERLSPFMRELVETGLVQQVFAPMHLPDTHGFAEGFVRLVESRLPDLRTHRSDQRTLLHIEKLGEIAPYLQHQDLAEEAEFPWFRVDSRVASWFMAYLAAVLGASNTLDAAPVTNRLQYAALLGGPGFNRASDSLHRHKARNVLLPRLLPVPDIGRIAPQELAQFKADHGASLRRLRRQVEDKCAEIARIEDAQDRLTATEAFLAQAQLEVGDVVEAMAGRWNMVNFGSLCTLVAAGVSAATNDLPPTPAAKLSLSLALLGAIGTALGGLRSSKSRQLERPLAYAAHVRTRWKQAPAP